MISKVEICRPVSFVVLAEMEGQRYAAERMFANTHEFGTICWIEASETAIVRESFSKITMKIGLEDAEDAKDRDVSTNLVKGWSNSMLKYPNKSADNLAEDTN